MEKYENCNQIEIFSPERLRQEAGVGGVDMTARADLSSAMWALNITLLTSPQPTSALVLNILELF